MYNDDRYLSGVMIVGDSEIFISVDGRNIVGGGLGQSYSRLFYVLMHLSLFAEKSNIEIRIDTVVPSWKDYWKYRKFISSYSRIIPLNIPSDDKEIDDYIVASLALSNTGYYLSNDARLHESVNQEQEWANLHQITTMGEGFGTYNHRVKLCFPDGTISEQYELLYADGELSIEFDEKWLIDLANSENERRKSQAEKPRYRCPTCKEEFPSNGPLHAHMYQTGHSCARCNECGENISSNSAMKRHKKETGHENYTGKPPDIKDVKI